VGCLVADIHGVPDYIHREFQELERTFRSLAKAEPSSVVPTAPSSPKKTSDKTEKAFERVVMRTITRKEQIPARVIKIEGVEFVKGEGLREKKGAVFEYVETKGKTVKREEIVFEKEAEAPKSLFQRLVSALVRKWKKIEPDENKVEKAISNLGGRLQLLFVARGSLKSEELEKLRTWTAQYDKFVSAEAQKKYKPNISWLNKSKESEETTQLKQQFIQQHSFGEKVRLELQEEIAKKEKAVQVDKTTLEEDNKLFGLKNNWKTLSKEYRKTPSDLAKSLVGKIDEHVKHLDELLSQAKKLPTAEREKKLPQVMQAIQKLEKQIELFRSAVPKFDDYFTRYKDREKFKSEAVRQVWDDITQEMVKNLSKQIDSPKATSIRELFIPLQEKIESLSPLLSYVDDFIEKTKGDQSLTDLRKRAIEVANDIKEFVPNLLEPAHRALPLSLQSLVLQLREIDSFMEQTYTDALAEEFGKDGSQVVAELRREGYSALVECLEKAGEAFKDTAGIRSLKFKPMIQQAKDSLASLKKEHEKMKPILPLFPYAEGLIKRIHGDASLQKTAESAVDNIKEFFPNFVQSQIKALPQEKMNSYLQELQAIEQFIEENYTKALENEFGKDGPAIIAELRKQAYAALIECLDDVGEAFENADDKITFEFEPLVKQAQNRLGKLKENLVHERQANREFLQAVAAQNARRQKITKSAGEIHDSVQRGLKRAEVEAQVSQKRKEPAKPTPVARLAVSGTKTKPPAQAAKQVKKAQAVASKVLPKVKQAIKPAKVPTTSSPVKSPLAQKISQVGTAIFNFLNAPEDEIEAPTPTLVDRFKQADVKVTKVTRVTEVVSESPKAQEKETDESDHFFTDLVAVLKAGVDTISLNGELDELDEIAKSRGPVDPVFSINPVQRKTRIDDLEEQVTGVEREVEQHENEVFKILKLKQRLFNKNQ
jgi:hypothetical protein